jgi:adenylate cyclase
MDLKKYIQELKKRNVIKAAIAYLVVGWLIMQVASIVLPTFDAPAYVLKTLFFILGGGFPIWIIFSWIYDITPEGIKNSRNSIIDDDSRLRTRIRLNRVIIATLSIVVILLLINLFNDRTENLPISDESFRKETLALATGPRIMVLPLINLSNNQEQEYFVDGLTEDLITALSQTNLFVLGSSSSFKYKNQIKNVVEIGEELGVQYIIKGSVRREVNTIRVVAQLVEVNSGIQVWGSTYDRDLTASNIFEVQDDITVRVVGTITDAHGIISRKSRNKLARRLTDKIDSYECVLRSYVFETSHKSEDHLIARDCLELTLEKDSTYVDGLAQLAYLYREEYQHDFNQRPNALKRSVNLAQKAVNLDGLNQNALYALALANFGLTNVDEFIAASNRAIELNPNNSHIIGGLGVHIALAGQWDWGIALLEKTLIINPHSSLKSWLHYIKASNHYQKDEYNNALIEIKQVKFRKLPLLKISMIAMLEGVGEIDRAEELLQKTLVIDPLFLLNARQVLDKFYLTDKDLINQFIESLQIVSNGIDL